MGHYDSCYEFDYNYENDPVFRKRIDDESIRIKKEAAEKAAQVKLEREEFRERMRRILVH